MRACSSSSRLWEATRLLNWTVLTLALWMVAAAGLQAQSFQATITGTIKDPTGSIVAGASVTATNVSTKASFSTVTNNDGVYTIPLLPIGQYEETIVASGFDAAVQHFELHGGDRLEINVTLHIGNTTQTVTVNSEVPLLENTSGDSGLTISPAQVQDLPLIARNPFALSYLAPGVYILPGQTAGNSQRPFDNGGFDAIEINGGRPETNDATIDGLADTGLDTGSATAPANIIFVPSPDMTQEFRVQTSVYDAQYGRTGGGIIAINLKSGTNQFHGVGYEYVRNTILNSNYSANDRTGLPNPPFHWNEPGLEVNGPVRIPRLYNGRDKTFFMFGWEDIRTTTPSPLYESVPTLLERGGDFSQSNAGKPLAIYDPLTTTQLPNGSYSRNLINPTNTANPSLIPANRIDQVAKNIAKLLPVPNVPGAGNVSNLYASPNDVVDAYDAFTYRVDQTISPTQHVFASYLYSDRHQTQGLDGFPAAISPSYLHYRTNYGAHVNWSSIISTSLVSSFGIGWNEHRFGILNHQPNYDLSSLGFPSYVSSSPAPSLFPQITTSGYSTYGNAGSGTGHVSNSDNFDLRETLIKTERKHEISFGGEFRPMREAQQNAKGNSTFGFGRDFTQANPLASDLVSGSGFASFLLGYADAGTAVVNPSPDYKWSYYALFIQDNLHLTDKLTITAGLRWDTETPIVERRNIENTGFDSDAGYVFAGQTLFGKTQFPSTSGQNAAYNWDKNNLGPRLGASYRVNDKLVIRGGYGLLYLPTFDAPSHTGYSASTAYVASNNNLLTPASVLSNPYPSGYLSPSGPDSNLNGQGGWTYWQNRTRKIPMTAQYSFGLEYQLPLRSILEIGYAGQHTDDLPNSRNTNFISTANLALGNSLNGAVANPFAGKLPGTGLNSATTTLQQTLLPYPQYVGTLMAYSSNAFTEIVTNGTTNYNSLHVRFEKRITNGLHFLAAYTWEKSLVTGYLNNQDTALWHYLDKYNLPQILTLTSGYNLPFFANSPNPVVKESLSGWAVNFIYMFSSSQLYGAPSGVQATGLSPRLAHPSLTRQFNTCTITTSGTLQNCEGNELPVWSVNNPYALNRTTPYFGALGSHVPPNLDISFSKSFPIHDETKLEFRAEGFNALNTPRFGAPDTNVNDVTFGARTNFGQTNNPRNIQLALRLSF